MHRRITTYAGRLAALSLIVFASGCLMPNWNRLIPPNKDANILILSPMYGQVIIQTRVNPQGTNTLPPMSDSLQLRLED